MLLVEDDEGRCSDKRNQLQHGDQSMREGDIVVLTGRNQLPFHASQLAHQPAFQPAHFFALLTTLGGHFAVLIVDETSLRTGPLFSTFDNLARLGRVSLSSRDEKVVNFK